MANRKQRRMKKLESQDEYTQSTKSIIITLIVVLVVFLGIYINTNVITMVITLIALILGGLSYRCVMRLADKV